MIKYPIYSGAGNTFVIVEGLFPENRITELCQSFEVDGVLLISGSAVADVFVKFYNLDGSEAESCGNGLRCLASYCFAKSGKKEVFMESGFGIYHATHFGGDRIAVNMTKSSWDLRRDLVIDAGDNILLGHFINTGVPHVVVFVEDVDKVDIELMGANLRRHAMFAPEGANVDFVSGARDFNGELYQRTYERGVERETLACGTGAVASALLAHRIYGMPSPIRLKMKSSQTLEVIFDEKWEKVLCIGEAVKIDEKCFESCYV